MERKYDNKKFGEKKAFDRGGRPNNFNRDGKDAKPKVHAATFEKARYSDFENAIIYRIKSGELHLDTAHEHLMLPENLAELKENIKVWYDKIEIPVRATIGSAGHDFATPVPVKIMPFKRFRIPTGIKCKMPFKQHLKLSSRSSIFGDQILIDGTIDADYYFSRKTAGIITIQGVYFDTTTIGVDLTTGQIKFNNFHEYPAHSMLANGVFMEYKRTTNEEENPVTKKRDGGFGHTTPKK